MSYEMRRPGPIHIQGFIRSMDAILREETRRQARWGLPTGWHRLLGALKAVLRPVMQAGAMVLTSVAVIVAVGVAPASLPGAPPVSTRLAVPTAKADFIVGEVFMSGRQTAFVEVAAEPAEDDTSDRPDTVRLILE
jgi:hypothetical protein